MLYKGALTLVALGALSLAVELALSQPHHPVNSVTAYMSKIDFDHEFANFDAPSNMSSLESLNTKREMLRREGMARVTPASNVQSLVLLRTRIVDSHVALSLFDVDESLYNSDPVSPAGFVMVDRETPMTNSEPTKVHLASAASAAVPASRISFRAFLAQRR